MNTLTQQQINQYQWQVADGVARIHNSPVFSVDWNNKEHDLSNIEYQTDAPDGIYNGEAFELEYQGLYESVWFKISELVYRNYITNPIDLLVEDTRLFLHLITPPAEQETETVEQAAERLYPIEHDSIAGPIANERARFKALGKRGAFKKGFAFAKSTLTQKDQRIAELEREREWISVDEQSPEFNRNVLLYCPIREWSNDPKVIAGWYNQLTNANHKGYYCSIHAHEDEDLNPTHWLPLPTPPQH